MAVTLSDQALALEKFVEELSRKYPVAFRGYGRFDTEIIQRDARAEALWAARYGRLVGVLSWGVRGGLPEKELLAGIIMIYGELPQSVLDSIPTTTHVTTNPER